MPQNPNMGGLAARPLPTSDSPSLIQQLLRHVIGGDASTLPPGIQEAMKKIQQENPDFDPSSVTGLGTVGGFKNSQAKAQGSTLYGAYNPLTGQIEMNPEAAASGSPEDIADTLLHEWTHVKQSRRPAAEHVAQGSLYGQQPDEQEAFQAENTRRLDGHRSGVPTPDFNQAPEPGILALIKRILGNTEYPTTSSGRGDIYLPPAKK